MHHNPETQAFGDHYCAQPDSGRAEWHGRIMAAVDGAAVRQAVTELLGSAGAAS